MGSESVPIRLSRLMLSSGRSLENALRERRSVREYSGKPLTRDELAQLLWAAQGMTGNLSQDPVCGTPVSVRKAEEAGRTSVYQGKTYYFDSDDCKKRFEKEPQKYVGEEGASAAAHR